MDKFGKKVNGASRQVSGLRSSLGSIGKGAALGGIGLAVAGVGALSVGLVQGFRDAASLQTMLAKTNAVVASTGGAANVSAASVLKMSDKLEAMSMIDQEAILQGQNLLLTFTNLRNGVGESNHVFDQATVAMVNVATAMGKDPQSAATMLGKALNDPLKGLTALGKAGVQFSDQQKKQIKTFVATGKTMDAQKVILKELEVQFGGAAKAAGSGFEGSLFRAKDALGDLFRDVATPLLPGFTRNIESLSTYLTNTATPAIVGFVQGFQDGTGAGGRFRDDMQEIGNTLRDAWPHVKNVADKTMSFVNFLAANPDVVKTAAVGVAAYATAMKAAALYTGLMALRGPAAATGIAASGASAAKWGKIGGPVALAAIAYGALAYNMKQVADAGSGSAGTPKFQPFDPDAPGGARNNPGAPPLIPGLVPGRKTTPFKGAPGSADFPSANIRARSGMSVAPSSAVAGSAGGADTTVHEHRLYIDGKQVTAVVKSQLRREAGGR